MQIHNIKVINDGRGVEFPSPAWRVTDANLESVKYTERRARGDVADWLRLNDDVTRATGSTYRNCMTSYAVCCLEQTMAYNNACIV